MSTLESGAYTPENSASEYCDLVISTSKMNGRLNQIWADIQSPCSGQLVFTCDAELTCTSSRGSYVLEVTGSKTFKVRDAQTLDWHNFVER